MARIIDNPSFHIHAFFKRLIVNNVEDASIYVEVSNGSYVALRAQVRVKVMVPGGTSEVKEDVFENGYGTMFYWSYPKLERLLNFACYYTYHMALLVN